MSLASVVIPAFNEQAVIDRCLDALCDPELTVIVVANGCTDDTAERARRHGVVVIDIAEASKIAALNAGDAAAGGIFPRIYLDADVVLGRSAAKRLAGSLTAAASQPRIAAPRVRFDIGSASRIVRTFYAVYRELPYVAEGLVGLGCYAVNETGRARWDRFPPVIADDLYAQGRFDASERLVLDDDHFTVRVPQRARSLVRVRTRTYRGNREAARGGTSGSMAGSRGGTLRALGRLARERPGRLPGIGVYLVINLLAALRARRTRDAAWGTDASSR